jgi:hypothetical protein
MLKHQLIFLALFGNNKVKKIDIPLFMITHT